MLREVTQLLVPHLWINIVIVRSLFAFIHFVKVCVLSWIIRIVCIPVEMSTIMSQSDLLFYVFLDEKENWPMRLERIASVPPFTAYNADSGLMWRHITNSRRWRWQSHRSIGSSPRVVKSLKSIAAWRGMTVHHGWSSLWSPSRHGAVSSHVLFWCYQTIGNRMGILISPKLLLSRPGVWGGRRGI